MGHGAATYSQSQRSECYHSTARFGMSAIHEAIKSAAVSLDKPHFASKDFTL
jgi:hypothetical protein